GATSAAGAVCPGRWKWLREAQLREFMCDRALAYQYFIMHRERLVNAMLVVIISEFLEFSPQVDCVQDQHVVKNLPSYRSDQPFHKRMRHGYEGSRLDLFDLKYAQIGEPTMETK